MPTGASSTERDRLRKLRLLDPNTDGQVAILKRVISLSAPQAVAMQGLWGRGKTHLWKTLTRTTDATPWTAYSYVSLFGVNSIDEIKLAIFERAAPVASVHDPDFSRPSGEAWRELGKRSGWRKLGGILAGIANPWTGALSAPWMSLVGSSIGKQLVCLDDLERRGEKLSLQDVLGLVTFLVEERKCSVVLIFNEAILSEEDHAQWEKLREKVFHTIVTYQPDPITAVKEYVLSESDDIWARQIAQTLGRMGCGNLRIAQRCLRLANELKGAIKYSETERASTALANSLALLTYCNDGAGDDAPSVEFALKRRLVRRSTDYSQKELAEDRKKRWTEQLSSLGYYPDEIDESIAHLIQHGYLPSEFRSQYEKLLLRITNSEKTEAFNAVWRRYHDRYGDDPDDFSQELHQAVINAGSLISAGNVDSSIGVLRRLGRHDLADECILSWVEANRDSPAEFKLSTVDRFRRVEDSLFRQAIVQAGKATSALPSLAQALRMFKLREGDLEAAATVIGGTPPEELVLALRNPSTLSPDGASTSVLEQRDGEPWRGAKEAILAAMRLMAESNPLDRLRAGRYEGILDEPTPDNADSGGGTA